MQRQTNQDFFNNVEYSTTKHQLNKEELAIIHKDNNIDIALLQEIKIPQKSQIAFDGYNVIWKERNQNGGRVSTVLRKDLEYSVITTEDDLEMLVVDLHGKETLRTINYYLPPNVNVHPKQVFKSQQVFKSLLRRCQCP